MTLLLRFFKNLNIIFMLCQKTHSFAHNSPSDRHPSEGWKALFAGMTKVSRSKWLLAFAPISALMVACASLPAGVSRPAPAALQHFGTAESFVGPTAAWPTARWWLTYEDPQLTALVDEALLNAPDLAAVEARFRRAQAAAAVERAALLPQLGGNASVETQKQTANLGFPPQFIPQGYNDAGRSTLDLSYEIDFWGKNRAAYAAATTDAAAAGADRAQAALSLSTAVAATYADLARLYADRDAALEAVKIRSQTHDLLANRQRRGLENLGAVRQSEAALWTSRSELSSVDETIGLTRNAIALLLGAGPDRGLAITRPVQAKIKAYGVPTTLAADLVGRRADIVASRLRVEANGKRIKVAKAAFYPNVNLVAFIGVQSLFLKDLFASGSGIGSVGSAIHLPIFDGGRLRGQYRGAEASYADAVATYNGTVVRALKEVADVLTSERALGKRLDGGRAGVAAASDAYRIAKLRYEGGLAPFITVLNAEDLVVTAKRLLADLESRAFTLDVALVRALGGGYTSAPPQTVSSDIKDAPHG